MTVFISIIMQIQQSTTTHEDRAVPVLDTGDHFTLNTAVLIWLRGSYRARGRF